MKKIHKDYYQLNPQSNNSVACKGQPLDLVLWQGEQWAVTTYGLERRNGKYALSCKEFFRGMKSKQEIFVFWFIHFSRKNWCNEDDIDDALQAMMVLFNVDGTRTGVKPPAFIGECEVEEYCAKCADDEYESARQRAIEGLVFNAP